MLKTKKNKFYSSKCLNNANEFNLNFSQDSEPRIIVKLLNNGVTAWPQGVSLAPISKSDTNSIKGKSVKINIKLETNKDIKAEIA